MSVEHTRICINTYIYNTVDNIDRQKDEVSFVIGVFKKYVYQYFCNYFILFSDYRVIK